MPKDTTTSAGQNLDRAITEEYIDYLRKHGASTDLIEFADARVRRFTQVDLDRSFKHGVWLGWIVAATIAVVFMLLQNG